MQTYIHGCKFAFFVRVEKFHCAICYSRLWYNRTLSYSYLSSCSCSKFQADIRYLFFSEVVAKLHFRESAVANFQP